MNQNHQFPSFQPIFNNFMPQSNFQQTSTPSQTNASYMTSVQNVVQPQQAFLPNNFMINQQSSNQSDHSIVFFYQPPNDPCNYHVNCKEISFSEIIQLLNEFFNGNINSNQNESIFFYQKQSNGQIYQITCEIVSSSTLNKTIYGIDIENYGHDHLSFTFEQRENLKLYLIQFLSHCL
ncbi:hypothetical protein C1645_823502 [Glomus cerebriforme]|uniref:Uncharacterized protein n=1 Tax=Glomus cerebriforme TaxID=658196 RepID=A0A397SWE0_9GLOM|nr:hypothetical protein C1645_823502 [Glomus cerebriforme]